MRDRVIVALDVDTVEAADAMARRLESTVCFFKIGLGLLFAPGVDLLIERLIADGNKVFLDAKMFDIPQTVRRAVSVASSRGVHFVTVHGDPDIMAAAVEGKGSSSTRVLAVTVLTCMDDAALASTGYPMVVRETVDRRARQAAACGCDGIVASAADGPARIRAVVNAPDMLVVTPGIRPVGFAKGDQKRVTTAAEAIRLGADYLVIGRPILEAPDPCAAATRCILEMEEAFASCGGS
jgi:orotidine-5'-phosphate decarboxylase